MSQVRRTQILLKADSEGANWTDQQIADAFSCTVKTVENVRQRYHEHGFEIALNGKKRSAPPRSPKLDGEQIAQVIALRLGTPPEGYAHWTLNLLKKRVVALSIVDSVSHETLRKVLKKTA